MGIAEKIRQFFRNRLKIKNASHGQLEIERKMTYELNASRNAVWYNGDSSEISQFFGQIDDDGNSFWAATQSQGMEIRKIHTGLPKLIVNTLTDITVSDLNEVEFKDEETKELWKKISKENNFEHLVKKATKGTLKIGDGAFKIMFDETLSELPIIEFYSGEKIDFTYKHGKITEVKFYNRYIHNDKEYLLEEVYGYGYVKYFLYEGESPTELDSIPETAGLEDIIFDEKIILAVPLIIFDSEMYEGRGQSVLDGKTDIFDALDETVSQWIDAIRSGRTKCYIPECLIPRDPNGGYLLRPNPFDNRFIKIGTDMSEKGENKITVEQPEIQTDAYLATYATLLDMALQGTISPSTLGIDNKKLDNAESQREKEKITLYSRQAIISSLSEALKTLVQATFDLYNMQHNNNITDIKFEVSFGEYANPSFEAIIESMSNVDTPMSIEAKVDEIWGDSKSIDWKQDEVIRIKNEEGISTNQDADDVGGMTDVQN